MREVEEGNLVHLNILEMIVRNSSKDKHSEKTSESKMPLFIS